MKNDMNNILKRLEAIEEILELNKKNWKELGWYCPNHPCYTSWCKNCIYHRIVGGT